MGLGGRGSGRGLTMVKTVGEAEWAENYVPCPASSTSLFDPPSGEWGEAGEEERGFTWRNGEKSQNLFLEGCWIM